MSFLDGLFGKPSKAKFAKSLMEAFKRAGDPRALTYDAAQQMLVERDGSGVVNLSNLYAEHCSLPRSERRSHLEQIAQSFASALDELPEEFEEARGNLRPKIWSRAAITQLELRARQQGDPAPDIPVYPLGDHLYSSIVYDLPHSMRSLSADQLETWGVTYYEALEVACQNLRETSVAWARIGEHFHSSMSGDNYDSSRVLLRDQILGFDTIGDPVAMVPNRDTLLIAGADDEESLRIMLELTKQAVDDGTRPLAPIPLRMVDGDWETWLPPQEHPLHTEFEQLELQFLGELYAEQKEQLEAILQQESRDIFVASYSGISKGENQPVLTYCVWGFEVDSLLPRAQFVVFVNDDGIQAAGKWDDVANIVGDLMTRDEEYYPPRYRVREFPSAAQLAKIGIAPQFE